MKKIQGLLAPQELHHNLDKLLRYSKCPLDRSSNGYEGNVYVQDEDTIICYFYGKVGH